MNKVHQEHEDYAFILHPYKGFGDKSGERFLLITPKPVRGEIVRNAWTHAVRYTAKALDTPDYPAATRMLLERHPSWQIVSTILMTVEVELVEAGEDIPGE